jgi:hypothetical protein
MSARRALLVTLACCGHGVAARDVRFENAPAAWVVNDRRDVAKPPATYTDLQNLDSFDAELERPITRALELPSHHRARGTNALDEVPDSTWFTNRIGVRDLTPDEVGNGPLTAASPEGFKPWTIHSTKPGGGGFVVTDTRGIKYLLKLDDPAFPEVESAADVIVDRLLWACGYRVPEDLVVRFAPSDLVIAPHTKVKDRLGNTLGELTPAKLAEVLAPHAHGGQLRALASRWLEGKPLGGPAREGVRAGDPNDRIPHQDRRDLRGEFPILAWVDHVDVARGNFLDMWVPDRHNPAIHYVEHYQIDFGRSLGAMSAMRRDGRSGVAYEVDYGDMVQTFLTLGMEGKRREDPVAPRLRGVAVTWSARGFDPGAWHPLYPYTPFDAADRFDKLWGAALVARFTREQIAAAVDAARLSDPAAARYIVDTLVERQRATMAYWFTRVNPLEHFTAAAGGVCFDDLAIAHAVASAAGTHYAITTYDRNMRALRPALDIAAAGATTCTGALALATAAPDGYTILRVATTRPGFTGQTFVHVARDASGALRVIGIWRT